MDLNTKKFEFNAPQFLDFTATTITEDDGADRYFDTDHENDRRLTQIFEPVSSSSQATPRQFQASVKPRSNDAVSSTNDVLDLSQRSVDLFNVDRMMNQQPPRSCRKVKPSYAPEIKVTEVDGIIEQGIVMVEVPHQGLRVKQHKRCTKVEPFSFEERDRQTQKLKDEKIKKILEEEKKLREFHAKPVPNFSQVNPLNFSTTHTVTDPIDIEFRTEKRLEERHKREKLCDKKEVGFQFRARPALVLQKAPFEPKKGDTALTDVTGIHLNTEERAKKREEFNCLLKEKEATIEMIRAQRRQEEEKQLLAERRRMRKNAEHKAAPVPRKIIEQPFKVLPSTAPLTEPKTPQVLSRKRKHE